MQKTNFILSVILVCLFALSCQEKKDDTTSKEVHELTARDIAYALGITSWRVRLPQDLGPDDVVSVAYKHADGSIEKHGGHSGGLWRAGKVFRFIFWEDGERLWYAVPEAGYKTGIKKPPRMKGGTYSLPQDAIVNAGDVLMMFTDKSSFNSMDLRPGDIGLIVHVGKKN